MLPFTPKDVYRYIRECCRGTDRFGFLPLSPEERRILGGFLFFMDREFVRLVGVGMKERPDLFAGRGVTGAELLDRQELANSFSIMRNGFLRLYEWSNDWWLFLQGTAVYDALQQVRRVEDEMQDGPEPPSSDARWREIQLLLAIQLLDRHKRKKRQGARNRAGRRRGRQSGAQRRTGRHQAMERLMRTKVWYPGSQMPKKPESE